MELKPLEWEGQVRGQIVEYGLNKADSGAISVSVMVKIDEYWDRDTNDWNGLDTPQGFSGFGNRGDFWIVKKDGSINQSAADSLVRFCNWDGDMTSIAQGTWQPTPARFTLQADKYKDEVRFKISWAADFNSKPGVGNVSADEARELQNRFGPQFRALAGNVTRNAGPPADKPKMPGNSLPKGPSTSQRAAAAKAEDADDIPFDDAPAA